MTKVKPQEKLEKLAKLNNLPYTMEVKQKALAMHLHLYSIQEIANHLGLGHQTIKDWVASPHWIREKKRVTKQLFGNLYTRRKDSVENIVGMGLALLERALADMLASTEAFTPGELQKVMAIISDANKMLRLEEGKPTDITANLSLTKAKEKIKELIKSDPFGEFDKTDAIEVDEEGNPTQH